MAPTTPIWWSNAIFFVSMHAIGFVGGWSLRPFSTIPLATKVLCFFSWQLASFGITIGYHRLWSHRSFTARKSLRIFLAIMGSLGFQGSIRWWCMRHRLHHRYTDDPVHDPYSATKGLLFSHMGWIFTKPTYERMRLVDRSDLDRDEVVRLQHKYYVPIALFFGLVAPTLLAALWGDALGGYIWGGVIARLLIWHCTFMINSLAHWEGLQPYTDEVTARGNFLLAIFTSGEGNHNFHAFPHDFRAGYSYLDWDPSKWIILAIYRYTNLITSLKYAKDEDILEAAAYMKKRTEKHVHEEILGDVYATLTRPTINSSTAISDCEPTDEQQPNLKEWTMATATDYAVSQGPGSLFLVIDGYLVDASPYAREHPGGASLLRKYALKPRDTPTHSLQDDDSASWAFNGGLNNHSRIAKAKMKSMRVAKILIG